MGKQGSADIEDNFPMREKQNKQTKGTIPRVEGKYLKNH